MSGTGGSVGPISGTDAVATLNIAGGGAVTVTTHGAVSGGILAGGETGIIAIQAGGSGNVNVTAGSTVDGGVGIVASAAGSGAVTIDSSAGMVTGHVADTIDATSVSGNISVNAAAVSGGARGIDANSTSGSIAVTTHGDVTGSTSFGINAVVANAGVTGGNVAVTTGGAVTGGAAGINASTAGASSTGTVTIDSTAGKVFCSPSLR